MYSGRGWFLYWWGLRNHFRNDCWIFNESEQYLDPSVQMLRTVPHLAVAPLFVLWFGFGETSKVLLIADGAFFLYT